MEESRIKVNFPIVEVKWIDSHSVAIGNIWIRWEDYYKENKDVIGEVMRSVGYVVAQDDVFVYLLFGFDENNVGANIAIPRVAIESIEYLKGEKLQEDWL